MLPRELGGKGRAFGASLFGDQRRRAARRKEESGEEKKKATAGMAGKEAALPSSGFFDGGRGSREGNFVGKLSSNPEMMWWRCRFQGAVTAAIDYGSSS